MRFLVLIIAYFLICSSCYAKELYLMADFDIYKAMEAMEKELYSKVYDQDNLYPRVERLETSVFGRSYSDPVMRRINRLKKALAEVKNNKTKVNHLVILDLLETRYFGAPYKKDPLEDRLTRLEMIAFGKKTEGDTDTRYNYLTSKIPLGIVGVSVSGSDGGKVSIKPEIKERKQYSLLSDAKYSVLFGDYFENISGFMGNKRLIWKQSPIYIYVDNRNSNITDPVKDAIDVWSSYISLLLINNSKDADIVIRSNKSGINKVEAALALNENSDYQIIIDCDVRSDFKKQIIAHQLGHALGIWGHSLNLNDIMYDFTETKSDIGNTKANLEEINIKYAPSKPSKRDINTLIQIYSGK